MAHSINLTLALFGALVLFLSLCGGVIKKHLYVSEPTVALGYGILVGPCALALIEIPQSAVAVRWIEQGARFTLAIALLDVATSLPVGYLRNNARPLLILLCVVLPLMCTVSTGLAWALLGLPFVTALLIGAVLAPTDPVLSSAVVTGPMGRRALPERVRELLLSESASNDALGFPLVMLPVLLLTRADSYAWWDWIVRILVWEVAAGSAFGAAAGAVAGLALRAIQRRTDITRSSLLTVSITLAFTVLGGVRLIHGEGLIAVLTAGLVLNHFCGDEMREAREDTHETLRRLFELPMFVILGVVLPWDAWREFGWPLLAFAAALLAFRRLPALFALNRAIAPVQNARETLFVGWFGPIGIAAMLYANLATLRTDNTIAWNVASFVIAASVILHGSSAVVLARRQSIQSD